MHIDEAALLEELVDRGGNDGAHAERRLERVRARTQILDRAQILERMALFLERIVGRTGALHHNGFGADLEGLRRVGRQNELALDRDRTAGGQTIAKISIVALIYNLHRTEAGAVGKLDKAHGLAFARGAHPSRDGYVPRKGFGILLQLTEFQHGWSLL